ncbi:D-aminoacyl-tRNA deacylase [Solwaraspora sp. WMMB335]|uniref:D-aminoacyl-tRNA deacylase n=1 Tax=Solwaraspora sp. WMMB335 TaxID=3404118 RepID=UPI003B9261FE
MRAVVQTVSRASVTVDDDVVASIGPGLLVLVGATHSDSVGIAAELARKVYELRIFPPDEVARAAAVGGHGAGAGERSAAQLGAPVLVVSQFTLYGDTRRGRRPSWSGAAPAEVAEPLLTAFVDALAARGAPVQTGRFRAHMLVESVNVGPQTILLEL